LKGEKEPFHGLHGGYPPLAAFFIFWGRYNTMKNIDDIILEFRQLHALRVADRLLECDWCGYDIEEDELVRTLKGPMHWCCWQEAEERGSFKTEPRTTPWPLEAVATRS
jgi:hypothetical protein